MKRTFLLALIALVCGPLGNAWNGSSNTPFNGQERTKESRRNTEKSVSTPVPQANREIR